MIILADDLAGAAEVGGVAHRHGLDAVVSRGHTPTAASGVLVLDTETRGASAAQAAQAVLACLSGRPPIRDVYKKTDSVLRGPIRAEIEAAMAGIGAERCLLVPSNPGRGRTIRHGVYFVDGVPLERTEFERDPIHPARVSNVVDLVGSGSVPVFSRSPGDSLPRRGIIVGDASSPGDLEHWTRVLDDRTLAAGAAEYLVAILASRGHALANAPHPLRASGRVLVVSGSASPTGRAAVRAMAASGFAAVWVPPRISQRTVGRMAGKLRVVVAIDPGAPSADPMELMDILCEAACAIHDVLGAACILAEGGSTAAALAKRLAWGRFQIAHEHAPGIVALLPDAAPEMRLVVKPGSYAWPPGLL